MSYLPSGYKHLLYYSNPSKHWSPNYWSPNVALGSQQHRNYKRMDQVVESVAKRGEDGFIVEIEGSVSPYSGYGTLTAEVCDEDVNEYEWNWSNPPHSSPILIGDSKTINFRFTPGDNLVNVQVSQSGFRTGEDTRYFYVAGSYYKRQPDREDEISQNNENELPQNTEIAEIFPNPFNPNTKIELNITNEGPVDLSVYTIMGQKVLTLKEGHISKGRHTFTFKGDGLSSGTYIVRLLAGGKMYQQNITLMK